MHLPGGIIAFRHMRADPFTELLQGAMCVKRVGKISRFWTSSNGQTTKPKLGFSQENIGPMGSGGTPSVGTWSMSGFFWGSTRFKEFEYDMNITRTELSLSIYIYIYLYIYTYMDVTEIYIYIHVHIDMNIYIYIYIGPV